MKRNHEESDTSSSSSPSSPSGSDTEVEDELDIDMLCEEASLLAPPTVTRTNITMNKKAKPGPTHERFEYCSGCDLYHVLYTDGQHQFSVPWGTCPLDVGSVSNFNQRRHGSNVAVKSAPKRQYPPPILAPRNSQQQKDGKCAFSITHRGLQSFPKCYDSIWPKLSDRPKFSDFSALALFESGPSTSFRMPKCQEELVRPFRRVPWSHQVPFPKFFSDGMTPSLIIGACWNSCLPRFYL